MRNILWGIWVEDSSLKTISWGLWIEDSRLRTIEWGLWINDFGLRTIQCGLWIEESGLRMIIILMTIELGLWIDDCVFRTPDGWLYSLISYMIYSDKIYKWLLRIFVLQPGRKPYPLFLKVQSIINVFIAQTWGGNEAICWFNAM